MNEADRTFTITGRDGTVVTAYAWEPDGPARGVVQLTHGMGEHALRYGEAARALAARGFAVRAQDHRGHGASAASADRLGVLGETGWAGLVDDIGVLVAHGRTEHPGLPVILLAHSMGSFAAQQWVLDHSTEIEGLVLTGTAAIDLLEPNLDLDAPLELAMFNAPFAPARTEFDWLSRDTEQVDRYVADDLCGFGLDTPGVKALFAGAHALADPARVAGVRADLPIRVVVGDRDPVNAGLALVGPLVERFEAAGVKDVTLQVWPDARHEVLNETNRAEVLADLIAWLDRVVGT